MIFFFRFLITILFLILIYIVYRSEIYSLGNYRYYYLIYFIGTLLAIVFFIICTYLKAKIQKYIIIILTSTIFTLYSFEGKLIFDQKKKDAQNVKTKINNFNFDRRSKFEVYEDLKKTNLNITMSVHPANLLELNELDFLSLAGISNTKTIYCNESGYYSIYQSDRYGFNNPDTEWDSKKIEYLLVGDSFTQGACVNRPDDIASVLRRYSKKNVLNLGQGGNGPLLEYATLKEYLTPNIENVLWLYYENDLENLISELKNEILIKYLTDKNYKQDLKFKQTQIDQFLTTYLEREEERYRKTYSYSHNIKLFIKLSNVRGLLIKPIAPTSKLRVILNLANELVMSHNGKLYFIYLPSFERYDKLIKIDYKKQIKKIVTDLDIEFIDIDEDVFQKEKNFRKLFALEQPNHYNVEVYKKFALKIYERTK